jgi:hypothetical protein
VPPGIDGLTIKAGLDRGRKELIVTVLDRRDGPRVPREQPLLRGFIKEVPAGSGGRWPPRLGVGLVFHRADDRDTSEAMQFVAGDEVLGWRMAWDAEITGLHVGGEQYAPQIKFRLSAQEPSKENQAGKSGAR